MRRSVYSVHSTQPVQKVTFVPSCGHIQLAVLCEFIYYLPSGLLRQRRANRKMWSSLEKPTVARP